MKSLYLPFFFSLFKEGGKVLCPRLEDVLFCWFSCFALFSVSGNGWVAIFSFVLSVISLVERSTGYLSWYLMDGMWCTYKLHDVIYL